MNDLISRKALIAEYDRVHIGPPGGARKLMEDAPSVDAVPVVRCENCKHCLLDLSGREGHLCMYKRKSLLNARVKRDDFCSWGERINDGICKKD